MATISMASHGHPSRNAPSGPLLVHFLHPMQRNGSTSMWPNGGWSSSSSQYMQSATGQYGTHAGDPAHPVQHSVIIANSLGRFLRGVAIPSLFGSILITAVAMDWIISDAKQDPGSVSWTATSHLYVRFTLSGSSIRPIISTLMKSRTLFALCFCAVLAWPQTSSRRQEQRLRQELKSAYSKWPDQDVAYILTDAERSAF